MTFEQLMYRATLGLEGNDIRQKAMQYLYDGEADMCRRAKLYQKHTYNLMVDPDMVHKVDMPPDFLEMSALPEWYSQPIEYNPKWREEIRRKGDGTWYTGTPYEYFMENLDLFLFPEPSTYVGDYKLAIWYAANAPSSHAAVAEITRIRCFAQSTLDGGEYFYISKLDTDYYVWFDLDDGSDDPAVSGRTGVEIDVATDDTAATIATALQTALDLISGITATVSSETVTVAIDTAGAVQDETLDVDTGFILNTTTYGQAAVTSPVFDVAYHPVLIDYARHLILLDDGKIARAREHERLYEQRLLEAKRHFKSRASINTGVLRDDGGGPIRRGASGGPMSSRRVKEVSVSST